MARIKQQPGLIDETAKAIRVLRLGAENIQQKGDEIRQTIDEMEAAFRVLRRTDDAVEIVQLADRLARIRELYNCMELGSFSIRMTNAMGEAWRRLP